jgi:hypothetical protein
VPCGACPLGSAGKHFNAENTEGTEKNFGRENLLIKFFCLFSVTSVFSVLNRFEDDLRESSVARVRDGQGDTLHAEAVSDLARRAGQF